MMSLSPRQAAQNRYRQMTGRTRPDVAEGSMPTATQMGYTQKAEADARLASEQKALADIRARGGNTNPIGLTLQTAGNAIPAIMQAIGRGMTMPTINTPQAPSTASYQPPPAAPMLPAMDGMTGANALDSMVRDRGRQPPWMQLLQQMPNFGSSGLFGY